MATGGGSEDLPLGVQQGIEESVIDYYDIMVIGKTGMGKSTTADKLLVANPDGRDLHQGAEYSEPVTIGERMTVEDLSIWLLSDASQDEVTRVKTRLKNVAFFRGLENPHQEINEFHSEEQLNSGPTLSFELISNESTKVRVLDVPGFFSEGDAGASCASPVDKANFSTKVAVGRMRNILQIQMAMHMKFRRILYFLPVHGSLKRSDSYLETELSTLSKYFGECVFNCMVVIATMPKESYIAGNVVVFDDKAMALTKRNFSAVLSRVLSKETDLPDPPILFVSMMDSCETVLANVQNAHVAWDHISLQFDSMVCARCGSKAKSIEKENIAVYVDSTERSIIPYEESTCHPLFIPKHTIVVRFFGGVVYLLSFHKLCKGYRDEICHKCNHNPGSHGCTQIHTKYEINGGYLVVDHTSDFNEPIEIQQETNL